MNHPTQPGQKFHIRGNNIKTYTVKGFFGKSGIEYSDINEASKQNDNVPLKDLCILNQEYGGASKVGDSILLNPNN